MSKRLMREGLRHTRAGLADAEFFKMIDATGGWPVGYSFVGFVHSQEREAGFCNSSLNDSWWTVLYHADDYYTWKLTPAGLDRIAKGVIAKISSLVDGASVPTIAVTNWRGWSAKFSTTQPTKEGGAA